MGFPFTHPVVMVVWGN